MYCTHASNLHYLKLLKAKPVVLYPSLMRKQMITLNSGIFRILRCSNLVQVKTNLNHIHVLSTFFNIFSYSNGNVCLIIKNRNSKIRMHTQVYRASIIKLEIGEPSAPKTIQRNRMKIG